MGVFQHEGPAVERGMSFLPVTINEATVVVIHQVKIVAFPRIIPQTKIPDEFIFGVDILYKYTGGKLGAEHDQCLHVDRMDIEQIICGPVGKGDVIKLVTGREYEAGGEVQIEI